MMKEEVDTTYSATIYVGGMKVIIAGKSVEDIQNLICQILGTDKLSEFVNIQEVKYNALSK